MLRRGGVYFEARQPPSTGFMAHDTAQMSHKAPCGASAAHKERGPISAVGRAQPQGDGSRSQGI